MTIITPSLIQALFTGFRSEFQRALTDTPTDWAKIATKVPSTTKSNTYGWLGQFPQFRDWVGDRSIKDIAAHGYSIANKDWESSVGVKRTDIEDDAVGVYMPLFAEMGRAASAHPDELVFQLLAQGTTQLCYDGQPFFDTEHPVFPNSDGTGTPADVSNMDLASSDGGAKWYLLDTTRAIKPILYQSRKEPALTYMTKDDDEGVFMRNEYRFGADLRSNVGFGFWQMAYLSDKPLTPENYAAARAAMRSFRADGGRPLGIRPNLLLVPPSLEAEARTLLVKDANSGNPWAGSAELLVSDWLA